jgi:hypothetical protein
MSVSRALRTQIEAIINSTRRKRTRGKLKDALQEIQRLDDDLENPLLPQAKICQLGVQVCLSCAKKYKKKIPHFLGKAEFYLGKWPEKDQAKKRMLKTLKIFNIYSRYYREIKSYHKAIMYL